MPQTLSRRVSGLLQPPPGRGTALADSSRPQELVAQAPVGALQGGPAAGSSHKPAEREPAPAAGATPRRTPSAAPTSSRQPRSRARREPSGGPARPPAPPPKPQQAPETRGRTHREPEGLDVSAIVGERTKEGGRASRGARALGGRRPSARRHVSIRYSSPARGPRSPSASGDGPGHRRQRCAGRARDGALEGVPPGLQPGTCAGLVRAPRHADAATLAGRHLSNAAAPSPCT